VNDQAAPVTINVYYELESLHDLTPNKHWTLEALQAHIAPYNQNGSMGAVFTQNPTIELDQIQYLQGTQITQVTSVTGTLSGILNPVVAPPAEATPPKFQYLAFNLAPNFHWLSGIERTQYQLHMTFILQANNVNTEPTLRIYGINYDFRYDYR
jgi:hypothetical protein